MDEIISLKAFFVEGGNQKKSHVILHITEPSVQEERPKGYFFVIGEINNGSPSFITKLNEAFNNAQTNYYRDKNSKNEEVFEIILKNLNQQIKTFKDGGQINCAIGVVSQKEILFSFSGHSPILLFYKKNGLDTFGTMELGSTSNTLIETKDENIFSQLIQGKISPTDFLFFGTHHLKDFFSSERLEKTLTTRSVEQSCQYIENVLKQLNSTYSFGGLIIHGQAQNTPVLGAPKTNNSNLPQSTESLKKFFNTEKNTSQTLLPRFNYPSIRPFSKNGPINQKLPLDLPEKNNTVPSPRLSLHPTGDSIYLNQPQIKIYAKKIGKVLYAILLFVWHFLFSILQNFYFLGIVIINYKNRRRTIVENWQKQIHSYKENIGQLPLITKILVIVCILLIAIFTGSILSFKNNQKKIEKNKIYQSQLNFIKTKKDNAESALIYKNENSAKNELGLAEDALTKLSCKTADEKKNCEQLRTELNQISAKIKKISVISPAVLANLNTDNTNSFEHLIKTGNKLLAFNSKNSSILNYNLATNEISKSSPSSTTSGFNAASSEYQGNTAVFLNNQNQLIVYDTDKNSFKDAPITFSGNENKISSMVMYNGRLYTLDNTSSQIYRHNLVNDVFGSGVSWVKQNTDLANARSFSIDGDVYVLKSTGEVIKLTKGIPQTFNLENIDPPLKEGSKIWTYNELKYLYILDSIQKRILIFDKEGKLLTQLTSPEFKNPTDFVIDEENKIGYLIDSNKIYKIILPI